MKPHPQPDHFSASFLTTNLETGKLLKQGLGEKKQEKSYLPGKRPKGQLQGDISSCDKKVSLKDFLLNFVTGIETAPAPARPEILVTKKICCYCCESKCPWGHLGPKIIQENHL